MMGVLQFAPVTLRPGQSRSWYLALGIDCTGEEYLTTDTFASALESTKCWWQAQNAAVFAACDPDLTAWMRWVGIQPTLRRICGCSFLPHHDYGRGGRGWRDLWPGRPGPTQWSAASPAFRPRGAALCAGLVGFATAWSKHR